MARAAISVIEFIEVSSNDFVCLLNPLGHCARHTGSGPPSGARFDARALRLRERDVLRDPHPVPCCGECVHARPTPLRRAPGGPNSGWRRPSGAETARWKVHRRDSASAHPSRAASKALVYQYARVRVLSRECGRAPCPQNDDSRAGKVGSKTITAGLQRGLNETVRSAFVRNTQNWCIRTVRHRERALRLSCVPTRRSRTPRALPPLFVWSVARDLADRSPSALWENRGKLLRDFGDRPDPGSRTNASDRVFAAYRLARRALFITRGSATGFATLARLVGVPHDALRFDPTKRRAYAVGAALGAAHDVLVTRFEDMADLPEIVRDVVPEFAPGSG